MEACFRLFGQVNLALGANPTSHFLVQVFLETRLSTESLEPLIGFLAYLEPKHFPEKQILLVVLPPPIRRTVCTQFGITSNWNLLRNWQFMTF